MVAAALQIKGPLHQEALVIPCGSYQALKLLKQMNRRIDSIIGDGSCFFRAISKEILGSQCHQSVIRHHVIQFVLRNPTQFQPHLFTGPGAISGDLNFHCKAMSLPTTWATNLEILATSTLFRLSIYFFTNDKPSERWHWRLCKPLPQNRVVYHAPNFPVEVPDSMQTHHIELLYIPGVHFDRIAPANSDVFTDLPPLSTSHQSIVID